MRYERLAVFFGLFLISSILVSSQTLSLAYAVPGTGKLYGTDGSNQNIFEVNPATGLIVPGTTVPIFDPITFGPIGGTTGIATDPNTGQMYMSSGSGVAEIFSVDPTTGLAAEICGFGTVPLPGNIITIGDIDFDPISGDLFATLNIAGGSGGSDLGIIHSVGNPVAANHCLVTFLGPFVLNQQPIFQGMEAIAFDANGILFGGTTRDSQVFPSDGTLYMIDWTSIAGTALLGPVGPFNQGQPQLGQPTILGGVASLQMTCGTQPILYGGTAQGGQFGGSDLLNVNIGSGLATDINGAVLTYQSNPGKSLSGLAYDQICSSEPPVGVGGDILPIDTTALLVAGAQTTASWIIALALSIAGIGAFVIKRKFI